MLCFFFLVFNFFFPIRFQRFVFAAPKSNIRFFLFFLRKNKKNNNSFLFFIYNTRGKKRTKEIFFKNKKASVRRKRVKKQRKQKFVYIISIYDNCYIICISKNKEEKNQKRKITSHTKQEQKKFFGYHFISNTRQE